MVSYLLMSIATSLAGIACGLYGLDTARVIFGLMSLGWLACVLIDGMEA